MHRLAYLLIATFLLSSILVPGASAQATVPFTMRLQQDQIVSAFPNGGTVVLSAGSVGVAATATLTITYTGTVGAAIGEVDVLDQFNAPSSDFAVLGMPTLPVSLAQNQSFTVSLRYLPATSMRSMARALFQYSEGGAINPITVNLTGVAPEFTYSYIPGSGNPAVVVPGGAIVFPATAIGSFNTATVVAYNKGSGPGVVNNVVSTGSAFQLTGLPLLPATVGSTRDLRFTVSYAPGALETDQGSLRLDLASGSVSFSLQGSSTGPVFAYDVVKDSSTSSVSPNQVIPMPDTLVNNTKTILFRVRNTGNADGHIGVISVMGAGYQLSGLPFLPLTLSAGGSVMFSITFAPTQPGQIAGRLLVGNDTFDLSAQGLGPLLAYSYAIGSMTTGVPGGGSVLFTPVPAGATASLTFTISNTGTAAGSVTSISIASASAKVFTLANVPGLPLSIAPQATASFQVQFTPLTTGAVSATLNIDAQTFAVSGIGNPPTPLPGYQFAGASGAQQAAQQPGIGVTLSQPYALPLTGTLTLTFNPEVFSDDPNVQFASGGRTITFTIPANITNAVFPNGTNQIRLQTGTVAGTITLTPTFATTGGVDLTPASPTSLNLTVAQAAPQVLNVQMTGKTGNSFSLVVTGFATSRTITQMGFQFVPVGGENVSTTTVNVNVESTFIAWYQSSTSKPYGSQYTATIPFTMQGSTTNVTNLTDTIQSVAVTVTNKLGSSTAQSVSLY